MDGAACQRGSPDWGCHIVILTTVALNERQNEFIPNCGPVGNVFGNVVVWNDESWIAKNVSSWNTGCRRGERKRLEMLWRSKSAQHIWMPPPHNLKRAAQSPSQAPLYSWRSSFYGKRQKRSSFRGIRSEQNSGNRAKWSVVKIGRGDKSCQLIQIRARCCTGCPIVKNINFPLGHWFARFSLPAANSRCTSYTCKH